MFTAETFQGTFTRALRAGAKAWKELTDQYHWSQIESNLQEIQKRWSEYTPEWARVQIMRVYNVDPNLYRAIAARLGGFQGEDVERAPAAMLRAGTRAIEKVGVAEAYRAFRVVPKSGLAALSTKIEDMKGPDDLRREVDRISSEKSSAARILGDKAQIGQKDDKEIDYRREYWRLTSENAKLRKENEALRSKVSVLETRLKSSTDKLRHEFNAKLEDLAKV